MSCADLGLHETVKMVKHKPRMNFQWFCSLHNLSLDVAKLQGEKHRFLVPGFDKGKVFKIHTNMATSGEGCWHGCWHVGGRQQNGCVLASDCIPKMCLRMLPACGCNGRSSLLYRVDCNLHVTEQNTTS